jgi:hypothetical protein
MLPIEDTTEQQSGIYHRKKDPFLCPAAFAADLSSVSMRSTTVVIGSHKS